jgi:hypothetical protein
VIVGATDGAAIVRESVRCAVAPVASVNVKVTDVVPVAVGVPERTPVPEASERPVGTADDDHV